MRFKSGFVSRLLTASFMLSAALQTAGCTQTATSTQNGGATAATAASSAVTDYRVTRIRFYPRAGHAATMQGGRFAGSITSPTNDFDTIVDIKDTPAEGQWTELAVPAEGVRAYRFVKYMAKNDVWGDIAEIEFYAGDRKLGGTAFATTGSSEASNDPKLAFDGNNNTFFRGTSGYGQYVGIDLGAASQVAAPAVSVAQGSYPTAQSVTLQTTTPGATILYSIDAWGRPGMDDKGNLHGGAKKYDGQPIAIVRSGILQAVAIKEGLAPSTTALAAYNIGGVQSTAGEVAEFHIGNSLTDTVNPWMEPLAASAGRKMRYYRFTIPGAPTDWLWNHPGSGFGESNFEQAFLARAPLTDLVTQPFAGHGRSIDNEAEYSGRFFDAARKHSPNVQMWLYVQWPDADHKRGGWSQGRSSMNGKELKFAEPATTWQEAARNHVRYTELVMEEMNKARAAEINAGKVKPVRIIPGGLALAELKTQIEAGKVPGMTDFVAEVFPRPDDIHMTNKGAYLISLVHFACIYKENPEGKVTFANSGLTPEQAKIFQRIAWEAAKNYKYSGLVESAATPKKTASVR